jgi:hypothetical protein
LKVFEVIQSGFFIVFKLLLRDEMAGSIQQIQQELTALETAIAELAQEFEKVYRNYLAALGQAISKQLVFSLLSLVYPGLS